MSSSDSSPVGLPAEANSKGASTPSSDSGRLPPPSRQATTGRSRPEKARLVRTMSAPCALGGSSPPAGRRILSTPHGVVSKQSQSAERTKASVRTKATITKNLSGLRTHGPAAATEMASDKEITMAPDARASGAHVDPLHRTRSLREIRTDASTTPVCAAASSRSSVVECEGRSVSVLKSRLRQHQLKKRTEKCGGISQRARSEVIQERRQRGVVTVQTRRHVLGPTTRQQLTNTKRLGVRTVNRRTASARTALRRRKTTSSSSSSTAKSVGSSPTKKSKGKTLAKTYTPSLKRKSIGSESAAKKRRSRRRGDIACSTSGNNSGNGASKWHAKKKRRVSKRPDAEAGTDTDLSDSPVASPQPLPGPLVQRRAAVKARQRLEKMSSTSSEKDSASSSPEWRPGSGSPLPVCWPRPSVGSRGRSRQRDHQPSPSRRRSKSVTQTPAHADPEEPSTSRRQLLRTHSSPAKECKRQETASESTSEDVNAVGKQKVRPSPVSDTSKPYRKRKLRSRCKDRSWTQKYISSEELSNQIKRDCRQSSSNSLEEVPNSGSLIPQNQNTCSSSSNDAFKHQTSAGNLGWDSNKELSEDSERHTSHWKKQFFDLAENDRETSYGALHTSENSVTDSHEVERDESPHDARIYLDEFKSHSPLPLEDEKQSHANVKPLSWIVLLDCPSEESMVINEESNDSYVTAAESFEAQTSDEKLLNEQHSVEPLHMPLEQQHVGRLVEVPLIEQRAVGPLKDFSLDKDQALSPVVDSATEAYLDHNTVNNQSRKASPELSPVSGRSTRASIEDSPESYKSFCEHFEGNQSFQANEKLTTVDKGSVEERQQESDARDSLLEAQLKESQTGDPSLDVQHEERLEGDQSLDVQHEEKQAGDSSLEEQWEESQAQPAVRQASDTSVEMDHTVSHSEEGAMSLEGPVCITSQPRHNSKTRQPIISTSVTIILPPVKNQAVSNTTLPTKLADYEQLPLQLLPVTVSGIAPLEEREEKSAHKHSEREAQLSLLPVTVPGAASAEARDEKTLDDTENGAEAQLPITLVEYMATCRSVFTQTVDSIVTTTVTTTASDQDTVTTAMPVFASCTGNTNAATGASRMSLERPPQPGFSQFRYHHPLTPWSSQYQDQLPVVPQSSHCLQPLVTQEPTQQQHQTSPGNALQTLVSSLCIGDSEDDPGYLSESSGELQNNTSQVQYPAEWQPVMIADPDLGIIIAYIESSTVQTLAPTPQNADRPNQEQILLQEVGVDHPGTTDESTDTTVASVQHSEQGNIEQQFQNRPLSASDDTHSVADAEEKQVSAKASASHSDQPSTSYAPKSYAPRGKKNLIRRWKEQQTKQISSSDSDTEASREELRKHHHVPLAMEGRATMEEFLVLQHDLVRYYSGLRLTEGTDGHSLEAGRSGKRQPIPVYQTNQGNQTADLATSDVSQAVHDGSSTSTDTGQPKEPYEPIVSDISSD